MPHTYIYIISCKIDVIDITIALLKSDICELSTPFDLCSWFLYSLNCSWVFTKCCKWLFDDIQNLFISRCCRQFYSDVPFISFFFVVCIMISRKKNIETAVSYNLDILNPHSFFQRTNANFETINTLN